MVFCGVSLCITSLFGIAAELARQKSDILFHCTFNFFIIILLLQNLIISLTNSNELSQLVDSDIGFKFKKFYDDINQTNENKPQLDNDAIKKLMEKYYCCGWKSINDMSPSHLNGVLKGILPCVCCPSARNQCEQFRDDNSTSITCFRDVCALDSPHLNNVTCKQNLEIMFNDDLMNINLSIVFTLFLIVSSSLITMIIHLTSRKHID